MRRTSEVIDCWFDSGSMPFAQYHYPFENKELFESQFPADFISEGVDQTRGWFYTLLVISTFLKGESSYKSCLVNELILDKKGKKMSKSVGNTVAPMDIMRQEGADPLRWYMITCSPVWVPTRFDREGVKEAQRKLLATLESTYNFFTLYANLDGWRPDPAREIQPALLDRWILSRLQSVTASVTEDLEALNLTRAGKTLAGFVLDDLSNWYVRLCRRRFWQGEMTTDKHTAFSTLYTVLESSLRLLAPFIPFTTEEIYRGLTNHADPAASVHLGSWPAARQALVDADLERMMKVGQDVVSIGRSLRQESSLKTRQPLGRLVLHADDDRSGLLLANEELKGYVAEELNIKAIETVDDPRTIAQLGAKANFRALGPRFGKQAPVAAKAITGMTPEQILELKEKGAVSLTVDGLQETFGFEEVMVTEEGLGSYVAGSGNGLTVALDTTLTEELLAEGLCREIINKVQNLRKKSGLEVSDRIQLRIDGPEAVRQVAQDFAERIMSDTLAESVDSSADLPYKDAFEIEGSEISIALGKV